GHAGHHLHQPLAPLCLHFSAALSLTVLVRQPLTRSSMTGGCDSYGRRPRRQDAGRGTVGGGATSGTSMAERACENTSASARLRAYLSRACRGFRPQRHSIMRNTEQCSYGPLCSTRRGAHGPMTMHGTRKPRREYSGCGPEFGLTLSSRTFDGGT